MEDFLDDCWSEIWVTRWSESIFLPMLVIYKAGLLVALHYMSYLGNVEVNPFPTNKFISCVMMLLVELWKDSIHINKCGILGWFIVRLMISV